MAHKSYAKLLKKLQELIARGTQVSDVTAGTPSAQIREWINRAEYCLSLLEDKIPTAVADFQRLRRSFEFKAEDNEEYITSESAYRPEGADVLLDFNFECLGEAVNILKFAATKLQLEVHSQPGELSEEGLGKALRAARLRAGHSQRVAARK